MQLLYVTEFTVHPADGVDSATATEACLTALGKWAGDHDLPIDAVDLLDTGRRDLNVTHGSVQKYAEWGYLESPNGDWVTRLDVVTVDDEGGYFTARVTVGGVADELKLRFGLSREVDATGLSPVADPDVRQPRVLVDLLHDDRLRLSSQGALVDDRYFQARGADDAAALVEELRAPSRLPVLLIHTRTKAALLAARKAASGLIGLVRVVTVDLPTARHVFAVEPRALVPYAGALLLWTDLTVPCTPIGTDVVNSEVSHDLLRSMAMAHVAPLSALIRGTDDIYRAIRETERASRADLAAARTAAAIQTGDDSVIVRALTQQRDEVAADRDDALRAWMESDARAVSLASEVARWKATAEQQRIANLYAGAATVNEQEDPTFDNAPPLLTADSTSFKALAQHLTDASEERIVFTPEAVGAWRKADRYPTPELMRDALIKLAKVGYDLYDGQSRSMGHVDNWVRENYDLKVSLQDDKMTKSFRKFTFQGRECDRTPHVKVNDGVPPQECGRVYFAFDAKEGRLIVDHVGLHY